MDKEKEIEWKGRTWPLLPESSITHDFQDLEVGWWEKERLRTVRFALICLFLPVCPLFSFHFPTAPCPSLTSISRTHKKRKRNRNGNEVRPALLSSRWSLPPFGCRRRRERITSGKGELVSHSSSLRHSSSPLSLPIHSFHSLNHPLQWSGE